MICFCIVPTYAIILSLNYCVKILLKDLSDEDNRFAIYFMPITFQMISVSSYLMLFMAIAYHLKIRFQTINEVLIMKFNMKMDKKVMKNWKFNNIKKVLGSNNCILNTVSKLHLQLNDVIIYMNKIFSIPITLFLAFNLFGLTFSLYETYDILRSDLENVSHLSYTLSIYFLHSYHFIYNFFVIKVSMLVNEHRNGAYDILGRILCEEIDQKLRKKILLIQAQMKHVRNEFSSGLFNIDWILLSTVIFELIKNFCSFLLDFIRFFF